MFQDSNEELAGKDLIEETLFKRTYERGEGAKQGQGIKSARKAKQRW